VVTGYVLTAKDVDINDTRGEDHTSSALAGAGPTRVITGYPIDYRDICTTLELDEILMGARCLAATVHPTGQLDISRSLALASLEGVGPWASARLWSVPLNVNYQVYGVFATITPTAVVNSYCACRIPSGGVDYHNLNRECAVRG